MNYSIDFMNVSDVCKWLEKVGNNDDTRIETQLSIALETYYKMHNTETERTDVLKNIFTNNMDNGADIFRAMECDVVTYMNSIPVHIAHVD